MKSAGGVAIIKVQNNSYGCLEPLKKNITEDLLNFEDDIFEVDLLKPKLLKLLGAFIPIQFSLFTVPCGNDGRFDHPAGPGQ